MFLSPGGKWRTEIEWMHIEEKNKLMGLTEYKKTEN